MPDPALLATLAAVHRRGAFRLAAAELGVTPSAISQRIRALEEIAGTRLICRGQPFTATKTGHRLIGDHDEIAILTQTLATDLPGTGLCNWLWPQPRKTAHRRQCKQSCDLGGPGPCCDQRLPFRSIDRRSGRQP